MSAGTGQPTTPLVDTTSWNRWLGRLIEPDGAPIADVQGTEKETLRTLARNKVPLLALDPQALLMLDDDEQFQSALAAEQAWFDTQREQYVRVRDAWLDRGIRCLVFKSAGNRPSFPHLSDNIDILVRPEDGDAAKECLRDLGYVEIRNVEEPHKYLFRKFEAGRCVSAIHVHEHVIWFVGFMDDEALWQRMRPSDDDPLVNVPSPEDAILINLAHACYENKLLRLNDIARVRHALQTARGALDWTYIERVASSRGWLDGLAFMVLAYCALEPIIFGTSLIDRDQQDHFEAIVRSDPRSWSRLRSIRTMHSPTPPVDLSYWFCKWLYYRKILGDPSRSLQERWGDAALTLIWGIKLKSGIRPQPGAVISFSGCDGSGKTAHARALLDALRLCEIKADYLWTRGGSTGLLGMASRLRARLQGDSHGGGALDSLHRRRRRLDQPFLRLMWAWGAAADQVGAYLFGAHLPALFGRVVICDRYVFDTAVEMDRSLPAEARWSRLAISAMLALTPRPDHGYVLDVSSEGATQRKSDEQWHPDREIERQLYERLAARYALDTVSTEGSFASADDRILRETIRDYMAGFETWLNAVFLSNPSQRNRHRLSWAGEGAE